MATVVAAWFTASFVLAPVVGCVIAGRSVWSIWQSVERDWQEAQRTGQ